MLETEVGFETWLDDMMALDEHFVTIEEILDIEIASRWLSLSKGPASFDDSSFLKGPIAFGMFNQSDEICFVNQP